MSLTQSSHLPSSTTSPSTPLKRSGIYFKVVQEINYKERRA